jgi:hypothetical protein
VSTRGLTIEAIGWRTYGVAMSMHVCYEVHEEAGGGEVGTKRNYDE